MNLYKAIIEYGLGETVIEFEAKDDSIAQAIVDDRATHIIGVRKKKLYLIGRRIN